MGIINYIFQLCDTGGLRNVQIVICLFNACPFHMRSVSFRYFRVPLNCGLKVHRALAVANPKTSPGSSDPLI